MHRRLARKHLVYVVAFSLVLAVCAAAGSLYVDYRQDLGEVDAALARIERSYLPAIASSVFDFNLQQLELQLNGVVQFRDVTYLDVTDAPGGERHILAAAGDPAATADLIRDYPLVREASGTARDLGTLRVHASFERARSRLLTRAILVLGVSVLETLLIGLCVLWIVQVLTVRRLTRIAQFTEAYLDESSAHRPKVTIPEELALIAALTRSVAQIIDETDAKLVVAWSHTGLAARLLSKARVDVPIIVFTPSKLTCRQMCLHYGVMPFCRPAPEDIKELAEIAEKIIYENDWAAPGDQTVLLAGRPLTAPGTNNAIMIHNLSETQPLI